MSHARLPTPLEWFVLTMLAEFYDGVFHVVTAHGTVMTGVRLK